MNQFVGIGNLGADPTVRQTKTGKSVASFSNGMNYKLGDKQMTDWVNVVVWEGLADAVAANLHKGSYVEVRGRIRTRSYETQQGEKRYTTECLASYVALPLDSRQQTQGSGQGWNQFGTPRPDPNAPAQYQQGTLQTPQPAENIPF